MHRKYGKDREKVMYEDLARELKKHIDVLTPTFEANNLQVLQFNIKPNCDEEADCEIYVELSAIEGQGIPANLLKLKINLYDDNDELYYVGSELIWQYQFAGYDTYVIDCNDPNLLTTAVKGRLYVVK